ncbi:MAG: hypothetical protein E7031_01960 [Akkermansiaceae bacterium]|nr:hypothetical protein [Akkermansiaceae bacterium]
MKKWHKRTLCILALGIVGLMALAYRTAFEEDTAEHPEYYQTPSTKLSRHDGSNDIRFEYRWQLNKSPRGTVLRGCLQPDAFSIIQPAEWNIKVYTQDGQLRADVDTPVLHATDTTQKVETVYYAYFSAPTLYYSPNGTLVAEHSLHLCCDVTITPAWWRTPIHTRAEQIIRINPTLGCADLVCHTQKNANGSEKIVLDAEEAKLPARFCGTKREQILQFLLYEFADAAQSADSARLQQFYQCAQSYTEQLTTPDKAWPDCWEEASAQARRGAQLIEPTLAIIQNNNCYNMQELADFINGPIFARIFGNQLKKREEIDFGDDFAEESNNIDFEIITEEEFYSSEKAKQKN